MTLELVSFESAKSAEIERRKGCRLTLLIHGRQVPFETANEASGIVCELREQSGLGAREFGSQFPIVDSTGNEVGWVSFNGRVWQGTRKHWKQSVCVYPAQAAWPEAWQNGKGIACAS